MAMTRCRECGHDVSTTADACPYCGAKIIKRKANNAGMDVACLITMVIALFMMASPFMLLGWMIELVWTIVYQIKYRSAIKNPEVDVTSLKKTRNACVVMFILSNFGIIIF